MQREIPKKEKRFYPDYLVEIFIAFFISIELALILALLFVSSVGRQIDFTRPFQPRPEWYFLWLFELVRYFPGNTAVVGTVLIPLLFVALLLMVPFIDRGRGGRTRVLILFALLMLIPIILTLLNIL